VASGVPDVLRDANPPPDSAGANVVAVKTATTVSAGGVVVGPDGVLLIARRSSGGELQWTLPKGLVDPGEDVTATAVREVREETGIDALIDSKLGTIDYWFIWKPEDTRFHKFVHYFLMRPTGGDFSQRDDEAEDVRWFPADEAMTAASFANERDIIARAIKEAGE
jgi:8-oxo-dGTP pyrophosphatase MutT (NUDIX family)